MFSFSPRSFEIDQSMGLHRRSKNLQRPDPITDFLIHLGIVPENTDNMKELIGSLAKSSVLISIILVILRFTLWWLFLLGSMFILFFSWLVESWKVENNNNNNNNKEEMMMVRDRHNHHNNDNDYLDEMMIPSPFTTPAMIDGREFLRRPRTSLITKVVSSKDQHSGNGKNTIEIRMRDLIDEDEDLGDDDDEDGRSSQDIKILSSFSSFNLIPMKN